MEQFIGCQAVFLFYFYFGRKNKQKETVTFNELKNLSKRIIVHYTQGY